jgi:hypothetical protein
LKNCQVNELLFDERKGEIAIFTVTGNVIRLTVGKEMDGKLIDLGERSEKNFGKITIGLKNCAPSGKSQKVAG